MKNKMNILGVIASSLVLAACTTSGTKTASFENKDTYRKVAAAGQIEYSTDTRQLPKVCGHAPDASVNVPTNQLALNSRKELVTSYVVRTPVYDCESTPGDGRGGDWKGFYDRSGDKASMLASAIKGVGDKTAPYLVAGFQAGKPRSWREFSDLITSSAAKMQRDNGINSSWTNNVLKQFKAENIVSLGYASATGCQITGYTEENYDERQFLEDITVVVETRIRGGKLLPGECEEYSVYWNGREVSGSASSDQNQYAVTTNYDDSRKAIVTFKGTRAAIKAAYFLEIRGSTASANGSSVTLNVNNATLRSMMQVPEFADSCKVTANAVIMGRKGSAWSSKKSAPLKSVSFALDGAANATSFTADGVSLKEGQHPVVKIGTSVGAGCPFFNTSPVDNGIIEN